MSFLNFATSNKKKAIFFYSSIIINLIYLSFPIIAGLTGIKNFIAYGFLLVGFLFYAWVTLYTLLVMFIYQKYNLKGKAKITYILSTILFGYFGLPFITILPYWYYIMYTVKFLQNNQ